MYDEQVAEQWAVLLVRVSNQHEAHNFAWNMAEHGCAPVAVRDMARRWRAEGFLPPDFADELDAFAAGVENLLQEGATRAWPDPIGHCPECGLDLVDGHMPGCSKGPM